MPRPAKYDRTTMLDRALDLFWTKGYEATSVHDLLAGLDIHRGTLYDSFGDKHSLFMEVLAHYQQNVGTKLLHVLAQPGSKKQAIHRLFQMLIDNVGTANGRRGCLLTNTAMELAQCDAQVATAVDQYQGLLLEAFRLALAEAQAAGEIPPRTPEQLQVLAQYLLSNLQGLRVLARTNATVAELHQVAHIALKALD
jgi:TetR/AcrR family transcriptional repressor of nem operon